MAASHFSVSRSRQDRRLLNPHQSNSGRVSLIGINRIEWPAPPTQRKLDRDKKLFGNILQGNYFTNISSPLHSFNRPHPGPFVSEMKNWRIITNEKFLLSIISLLLLKSLACNFYDLECIKLIVRQIIISSSERWWCQVFIKVTLSIYLMQQLQPHLLQLMNEDETEDLGDNQAVVVITKILLGVIKT